LKILPEEFHKLFKSIVKVERYKRQRVKTSENQKPNKAIKLKIKGEDHVIENEM
jgi:hypothetical protein